MTLSTRHVVLDTYIYIYTNHSLLDDEPKHTPKGYNIGATQYVGLFHGILWDHR
jgi:hypothetical protein